MDYYKPSNLELFAKFPPIFELVDMIFGKFTALIILQKVGPLEEIEKYFSY